MTAKKGPLPDESAAMSFPSDRAFVVQFAVGPADGDPFRGRVEHLASGQVTHFDSLGDLAEFVALVLGGRARQGHAVAPRGAATDMPGYPGEEES